ncbi:MAG: sugar porter family MFS transporter [Verrucomicrobiota bacterium]|jgi:sugar porter (SP) family MFS transporter
MTATFPSSNPVVQATPAKVNLAYLIPICLVATIGGLLFGYDTGVISGAIEPMTTRFALSAAMKGWVSGCVLVGCAVGVVAVGPFSDRFGRKRTMILAAALFMVSAIGAAMPSDVTTFIVFRFLGGLGIGIASMSTPMYIAEITPGRFRGRMVAVNQIAIVIGLTSVYFVNYAIACCGDVAWLVATGWRWMFASGAVPAAAFGLLLLRIPESPRWLVEAGRGAEAEAVLGRVGGVEFARSEAAAIRQSLSQEQGTWAEVFSPALRLPLVLGISLAVLQQVTGINVFMYFGTTIFKGMAQGNEATAGMIQQSFVGVAGTVFTLVAIACVDQWGRKPLMFLGTAGMLLSLAAMGAMAQTVQVPASVSGWMLACIIVYLGCFSLSAGPVIWIILSEIFPNAVRGRALGLATFWMWIANYAVTQTFTIMDQNAWLLSRFKHAFPFYIYAGFCVVLLAVMLVVPETRGKSLEEIEQSWRKTP